MQTRYPELALEWDVEKNKDIKPQEVFPSSNKSVWWKCSICGQEWKQLIVTRVRSGKCPNCKGECNKGKLE